MKMAVTKLPSTPHQLVPIESSALVDNTTVKRQQEFDFISPHGEARYCNVRSTPGSVVGLHPVSEPISIQNGLPISTIKTLDQ